MRPIIIPIFILAALCTAGAQHTWHKMVPGGGNLTAYCQLSHENGLYQMKSSTQVFHVNASGEITGNFSLPNSYPFLSAVLERYAAGTGHPYFLIAQRPLPPVLGYTLTEYRPGKGYFHQTSFQDSLGAINILRTKLVSLNDSIFVVFGGKFYRKIHFSPNTGFTELWSHPLQSPVADALLHNNQLIVADDAGNVYALDADGNTLWSKNAGHVFRTLRPVSDGLIGCIRATQQATIVKLDFTGTELWTKTSADVEYFEAAGTSDGGIVATGISGSSKIALAKFSGSGEPLWKREYSEGTGTGVLAVPDGGFVVMGRKNATLYLIKTDENGNAPPVEAAPVESRQVKTAGIAATLFPSPSLFFSGDVGTLISPPDSAATVLSFAPWIGGQDENGQLHIAAANYAPYNEPDYRPGLWNSPARDFSRVWLAKRDDIERLRLDFGADQLLDQPIPFDLLSWPAKGNPHFRYNLDFSPVETDADLFPAPFVDANGDGMYNVYDGDYPRMKGDQMAWWVLTDSTEHNGSFGEVVGIDLGISAYVSGCTQNTAIENSLLVDFEVINRGLANYQNTFMGFFTDFDLGCTWDDYYGSLPGNNTFYTYNINDIDYGCQPGINGFGDNIPVQTVTLMNQSLDHSIYFNNPAVGVPLPGTTDPETPDQFYTILQGKWKDGTPLTAGGTGYNPGSANFSNHAFSGNPSDAQAWSMCTVGVPFNDRRFVASHGPFDFASGDTFRITTAFTLHFGVPLPCPNIDGFVKSQIEQLQQAFDNGSLTAGVNPGQVVILPPGGQGVATLDASTPGAVSYLWSTGAVTPGIDVTEPGDYSVVVTLASGCQVTENVLVQLGTGAFQPAEAVSWKVIPNPAGGVAWVECPDCRDEQLEVVVRNAQGSLLRVESGQKGRIRLELNTQPAGFYWLELWQGGRFLGTRKLAIAGH